MNEEGLEEFLETTKPYMRMTITEAQNHNIWTNGKLDKEKIKKKMSNIKRQHEIKVELYKDTDKIINIGNYYYNLSSILCLLDLSADITKFWGGFVEISQKYVYSLSSMKWRYKGSAKWSKKYIQMDEFMKKIHDKEI